MRLFAIGDLHLSLAKDKPMDIFGEVWRDHAAKLRRAWCETVHEDDWVLIPGDISWAMQLEAALPDLCFLGELPGSKLLLKGNHDYWWSSRAKVVSALPAGMAVLQNDCRVLGETAVCGTRGWLCPGASSFSEADQKIYARELQRLELSLKCAPPDTEKLVMLHYPPLNEKRQSSGFTELFDRYGVKTVVYAHLHGAAHRHAVAGELGGVRYVFAAADYLDFCPCAIEGPA